MARPGVIAIGVVIVLLTMGGIRLRRNVHEGVGAMHDG